MFVKPDPDYFTQLASVRGDPADRAFFSALKATYPESVWPVYVERQTDHGGCTRFGSMTLVGTYRAWFHFQRTFPGRYAAGAKKEVDAVVEHLAESTCVCGDLASIERELQGFLERLSDRFESSGDRPAPASAAGSAIRYSDQLRRRIGGCQGAP